MIYKKYLLLSNLICFEQGGMMIVQCIVTKNYTGLSNLYPSILCRRLRSNFVAHEMSKMHHSHVSATQC